MSSATSTGRDVALSVRLEAERGRRLDRGFTDAARTLDSRDRAFAYELTYGVTRLRGRLDHLIAPHVRRGMASVDPTVLELLRLGAYQLLYMEVPPYAAVSETVDQVRVRVGGPPAGFVNAVLRRVRDAGDGPERFPDPEGDPVGYLSTWGSHPEWLVRRWTRRWGADEARQVVEAGNARPAVHVVSLEMTPEEAVARLAEADLDARPSGEGSLCVRLDQASEVGEALERLSPAIVQDPAANLVSRYADVPSGTMVADLCAAPGGKILAVSGPPRRLVAADRSESRIHMLEDNARRTGRPLEIVVADARHPAVRDADVVLLDVPCSGTGTLARHPDARWRLTPTSIQEMAALQEEMLLAAADVVRPGGLLVYSTCTLEPEENEERIHGFLARRTDFTVEAPSQDLPHVDGDGLLRVLPRAGVRDGAFAARMRRAA